MSEHQYTVPRNQGHFVLAKYDGKNRSGVTPIGKRVLVKMDEVPEVSAGGVALPGSYVERTSMASETGIIVEASPEAFTHFGDGMPWKGYRPVSGDQKSHRHSSIIASKNFRRYAAAVAIISPAGRSSAEKAPML